MPRESARTQAPPPPPPIAIEVVKPSALVASAVRFGGGEGMKRIFTGVKDWQAEAWRQYDICGELRFAANWIGNVLSKAQLSAAKRGINGKINGVEGSPQAQVALAGLFAGTTGQAEMLKSLGLHLTVAGEAYIVGRTTMDQLTEAPVERWEVIGVKEITNKGKRWTISYGNGMKPIELSDDDVVIRVWIPHPRAHIEADSPVRPLLSELRELEFLDRHVWAQITSRLAGAGLLLLPQGMTFATAPSDSDSASEAGGNDADNFLQTLGEAMMTPITDPSNPAAIVPVIAMVPDDMLGKSEFIKFWTDLDTHAGEMRDECIRRIAMGLDMPSEIVLGMARSGAAANHWTAWQIEEAAIKVHIEPLLQVICDALTDFYLVPSTEDITDCVGYDTAAIRLRPDRSKEAFELYDRGELTDEALRRENGFDETDAPDDTDRRNWLLRKVASGSASPEQVQAALAILGVKLDGMQGATANEARPTRSLTEHPNRDLPVRQALTAAADALVFRALERAGNRMRGKAGASSTTAPSYETHISSPPRQADLDRLMEGAWECAPQVLAPITEDVPAVIGALDGYCRVLLANGSPHTREAMARWI